MKAKYSTQDIEKKLFDAGLQPTMQRIALSQYIMNDSDHPTAEEVFAWAEQKLSKISQATVYNTLNSLVNSGLIRSFRFPHSDKVIYDCKTEDHFHFIDESSGKVYDISAEDIKLKMEIPKKYKINSLDVFLKGEIKK